ncbi:uncharacterized protein LOC135963059 [Calliphora vicina]|uniref:uncharacterized protein LOC135963059 n=1 Tax=Calliphora vicina TaxID=7373 RepID=UPI00325B5886
MTDNTTPRRISERRNKGVPPAKFGSFDVDMGGVDRTPPPPAQKQTAGQTEEDSPGTSAEPQQSSNTDMNALSREFGKKMDEMRNEFNRQLQAMQALMISNNDRVQSNIQKIRNELRRQPTTSTSDGTQFLPPTPAISAATNTSAGTQFLPPTPAISAATNTSAGTQFLPPTPAISAATHTSAGTQFLPPTPAISAATNASAGTQFLPPTPAISAAAHTSAGTQFLPPAISAAAHTSAGTQFLPPPSISADTHSSTLSDDSASSQPFANVPAVTQYSAAAQMPSVSQSGLQNKKIYPLPHFSGQPEEWQTFIEAYQSTTREFQYSNLHNIMRIRDALSGRAKDTVEALLTNSANVAAILETLEQNYGRPEQLIKSQIEKVRTILPVAEGDLEGLIVFANKITNMSTFLQNAKGAHHLSNPMLLNELVVKMPICRQMQWAEACLSLGDAPTIVKFSQWLNALRKIASTVTDSMSNMSVCSNTVRKQQQLTTTSGGRRRVNVSVSLKTCGVCENQCASVDQCESFLKLPCDVRWKKVKDMKICFSCLKKGHRAASCYAKKKCGINGCNRVHHRLLHDSSIEVVAQNPSSNNVVTSKPSLVESNTAGRNCHLNEGRHMRESVLFQIIPVKLYGHLTEISTYAFIDDGSNTTMIDAKIAHELGISGKKDQLEVQWFIHHTICEPTEIIDLAISGVHENAEKFHISKVFTSTNITLPHQSFCRSEYKNTHINNLPIVEYKNIQPKIIISLAHAFLTVPIEVPQTSISKGPIAVKTRLGWLVYGPYSYDSIQLRHAFHVRTVEESGNLEKLLTSYFGMETFGIKPNTKIIMSKEDTIAIDILNRSTVKVGDRFVTPLLWKENFSRQF